MAFKLGAGVIQALEKQESGIFVISGDIGSTEDARSILDTFKEFIKAERTDICVMAIGGDISIEFFPAEVLRLGG